MVPPPERKTLGLPRTFVLVEPVADETSVAVQAPPFVCLSWISRSLLFVKNTQCVAFVLELTALGKPRRVEPVLVTVYGGAPFDVACFRTASWPRKKMSSRFVPKLVIASVPTPSVEVLTVTSACHEPV